MGTLAYLNLTDSRFIATIVAMTDKVQCPVHGLTQPTYVCSHIAKGGVGLGFNLDEHDAENPYPDAWCDDCELIRDAHGGWNEESEELTKISLLCAGCYERARIRNTRTGVSFADLGSIRWKCSSCDEWHKGPCLDFGYDSPHYWSDEHGDNNPADALGTPAAEVHDGSFLNEDFCSIENRDFFVRGVIHLPIIRTDETFRWGVWGSLSKENFERLLKMDDDPDRTKLQPMFSWLSTELPDYPSTLSMKMYAHIQPLKERPRFELEPTEHPLSKEYHHGIEPEHVREIMLKRLKNVQ